MLKNRGFMVGMSNEHIKKVIEAMSLKAFAEETDPDDKGDTEPSGSTVAPSINYEDLIAKARKEVMGQNGVQTPQ